MIDFNREPGKAYVETYTLEDLLQAAIRLGSMGYKLCLENKFFCFNIGGNYTAYFEAPVDETAVSEDKTVDDSAAMNINPPEEEDAILFTEAQDAALAQVEPSPPSDVNTAATPPAEPVTADAPRRGRPPRNRS